MLGSNMAEIKVKDNGSGIAEEYQAKIFEKFFRIPQGDQHNIKGYGLGLSYVKEIVRTHGGNIIVESARGNGSSFIITIPVTNGYQAESEDPANNEKNK